MALVDQPDGRPSYARRAVFTAAGLVLLALWGASTIPVIQHWNNPASDGFEAVPVFYASFTVLPIGIVVLVGALKGSPSSMRKARGGLVAAGGVFALLALLFGFMLLATIMNWG